MDDHVEEIERTVQLPVFRLAGLFVSAVGVITALVAAWENLTVRAISIVLLGALLIYALIGGLYRRADSRVPTTAGRRLRRAGVVATTALVGTGLMWTWGQHTAPDLHITEVRLGAPAEGGGSLLLALDGGTRTDLVTQMTVLTAVEQISECGGDQIEVITVSPTVGVTSQDAGSVVIHGQQESSLQPGAEVRIEGGVDSDHCGESSWLDLRPQQPVDAGSFDQILVEFPAAFAIETSTVNSLEGPQPVESVLEAGTFENLPGYADYLGTILPGMEHPVLSWPWTLERAELEAAGWRAVLLVAVTSADGECALAAADLMADHTPLLTDQAVEEALASSKTRNHIPAACT